MSPLWPVEYGGTPPEDVDAFHGNTFIESISTFLTVLLDLIWIDELTRSGVGGVLISVFLIPTMALPPVLYFGSKYLKDKVCRDVITGKKVIALAVTEP